MLGIVIFIFILGLLLAFFLIRGYYSNIPKIPYAPNQIAREDIPSQITKEGITLDAYVPCGKNGELIKYTECENPEKYDIISYGTTNFSALSSPEWDRIIMNNDIESCKKIEDGWYKVYCIALIAKRLENKSVCDEATKQKNKCLEWYDKISFLEPVPFSEIPTVDSFILDKNDLYYLKIGGFLFPPKDDESINQIVKEYNNAVKAINETKCLEIKLRTLCIARIAKLKKQKDICNILSKTAENTAKTCYDVYDNIEIREPLYCETASDCRFKIDEGLVDINKSICPLDNNGNVYCLKNECVWVCS